MRICRFAAIILVAVFAAAGQVSGLPDSSEILAGIEPSVIEVLYRREHVFRYDEEGAGVRFFPDGIRTEVYNIHRSLNPEVMVEALYSIPYPADYDSEYDDINTELYRLAHRVTSITGVQYYPDFGKRPKTLFTDAYAVDNTDDRTRISDPLPPDSGSNTVYMHMKEDMLGRGYYRMDFEKNSEMLTVSLTNETALGFFFKAVEPGDLKIVLHFIPCSDRILAYGYSAVVLQADKLVSLVLDPYYAFYRRMTAMEMWLYNSLHGTDRMPLLYEPMP